MNSGRVLAASDGLTSTTRDIRSSPATGAIADEIEIQLLVERRIDRVRSNAGKKRVAVRGCTYNGLGGDIAASAGPVLDNKMLPQPLRQPVTDQTRDKVG